MIIRGAKEYQGEFINAANELIVLPVTRPHCRVCEVNVKR